MKNKYTISLNKPWLPPEEFRVEDNELYFIMSLDGYHQAIWYSTESKLFPKISSRYRSQDIVQCCNGKVDYQGDYHYCLCTKVPISVCPEEALKNEINLENFFRLRHPHHPEPDQQGCFNKSIYSLQRLLTAHVHRVHREPDQPGVSQCDPCTG